jgi:SAM-dependent methyltransferase
LPFRQKLFTIWLQSAQARLMTFELPEDIMTMYTQQFWDERYDGQQVWSGNPNPQLVEQIAGLTGTGDLVPGTALEIGCGEGADAIWLAGQGWDVTGLDISPVALARAAEHAAAAGVTIEFRPADLLTWRPSEARFDLVSAQFIHLPAAQFRDLLSRVAGAVRSGGTLLVVGHYPLSDHSHDHDAEQGHDHDHDAERGHDRVADQDKQHLMLTAEQLADLLDPAQWIVEFTGEPDRAGKGPDGTVMALRDSVVRARRR